MSRSPEMRTGDALAMIIIAVATLLFAVSLKAPDLIDLLASLLLALRGGAA